MVPRRLRGSLRLLDPVQLIDCRMVNRLTLAGRPSDDDPIDRRLRAEPVVQPSLVLRAEAAAAADFLNLNLIAPVKLDACADRAAVARLAFQGEVHPMASRLNRIAVDEKRSALLRRDDIQCAAVCE